MKTRKNSLVCKLLAFTMLITCVFGAPSSLSAEELNPAPHTILGDVDLNQVLTAADAAMVLKYALGKLELTPEQQNLARVTGNAKITPNDASLILQKVLNSSVQFIPYTGTETSSESTSETTFDEQTSDEQTSESTTDEQTSDEQTSDEQTSESTTDEPVAANVSWNFSDSDFSSDGARPITEPTVIKNLTLIPSAAADRTTAIREVSQSYNGTQYTHSLYFGGSGSRSSMAVSFDVSGPCTIKVIGSGNTNRYFELDDGDSKIAESSNLTSDLSEVSIEYNGTAKTLYLYGKGGGVYLYKLSIEYGGSAPEETTENTTESEETTESTESTTTDAVEVTPNKKYSLTGFGSNDITGGGVIAETDSAYVKVRTAQEFDTAITNAASGKVKVIEILNDLNLGSNELGFSAKNIKAHSHQALNSDILKATGISQITFSNKINGLTIYSKNGAKIKHVCLVFSGSQNVILRNLEFDELWEWDEGDENEAPGNYDVNDWDYITFDSSSSNMWVDHCTFNKAYDGLVDIKNGSNNVVISWCQFLGDDQSDNSWVTRQINQLEEEYQADLQNGTATPTRPLYYYLRNEKGYTPEQIIAVEAPQKKAHLVGHSDKEDDFAKSRLLSVTIYNNYYKEIQDRIPRLRAGNAHVFNTVIDSSGIYAAKKEIDPSADSPYHFGLSNQAVLSTRDGALKIENSHMTDVSSPLRFEQTSPYKGKLTAEGIWFELNGTDYGVINDGEIDEFTPEGKGSTMDEFSWNEDYSDYIQNGELTYDYKSMLMDITELDNEVKSYSGAGAITWDDNSNWLKTEYTAE